ncbi:MAG: imidazolonepropionase [Oscillospiraceae bacterium]|nr:imidazolonepropionase [Oscillospiraceae bacterium]
MLDLIITNIGTLATPEGKGPKRGIEQGDVRTIPNAAVGIRDGIISYVGPMSDAPAARETLDAGGRLVTPGLVDSHTHLVFGGWRHHELDMKLKGVSYLDILKGGGGILSSVRSTRSASAEELTERAIGFTKEQLALGVTTSEAKSGYGLTSEDELKQLRVVRAVDAMQPVDLVPTFLGAHALPQTYKENRGEFIRIVCEEMLPAVAEEGLAEFCDIFCETGVFTPEETRTVLSAAKAQGFKLKAHTDEIDCLGGAQVAAELGAVSAEHLITSDAAAIAAMAEANVIGVLLPATSFYLDKPYAPARAMLDAGMALAVASDFNPGSSPSLNLQLAMTLACLKYRLTPEETLTAATLNAAAAIDRADVAGSVEVGKKADLVIWETDALSYLFYRFGSNLVHRVVKNGVVV